MWRASLSHAHGNVTTRSEHLPYVWLLAPPHGGSGEHWPRASPALPQRRKLTDRGPSTAPNIGAKSNLHIGTGKSRDRQPQIIHAASFETFRQATIELCIAKVLHFQPVFAAGKVTSCTQLARAWLPWCRAGCRDASDNQAQRCCTPAACWTSCEGVPSTAAKNLLSRAIRATLRPLRACFQLFQTPLPPALFHHRFASGSLCLHATVQRLPVPLPKNSTTFSVFSSDFQQNPLFFHSTIFLPPHSLLLSHPPHMALSHALILTKAFSSLSNSLPLHPVSAFPRPHPFRTCPVS